MGKRVLFSTFAVIWTAFVSRSALAIPAQEPLFLTTGVSPMVMFALSVDHQLFVKAFADYSDLNGDGVIDNTYTDSFDYYGYFASNRCYSYDATDKLFEPESVAVGPNGHHCTGVSGDYSGNFLNWAAMTRIDVLRKALYGGKRLVDSTARTILERALLPYDVHAFAKVFTPAAGDSTANYTPYTASSISMCNLTQRPASGDDETDDMDTAVNHPKVLFASGSWPSWSAGEVYQCVYAEDEAGNNPANTFPPKANNLVSPNTGNGLSVRVDVCVANKLEANCKNYDSGAVPPIVAKPFGLLQEYGEDGTLRFGLTSGSYDKRDAGGVLRKAISYFAGNTNASDDEVNLADGTFNSSVNGIVATLDKVRINDYDYSDKKYDDCNTYGIPVSGYQAETYLSNYDAKCSNWGNPVSELYLEAVRYLMGEGAPTGAFTPSSNPLSLPIATNVDWADPMPANEWCTPMNVVVLSSGDNSFDTDDLSNVPTALGSVDSATDAIGVAEGFSGSVFIGEVGATPSTNPDANACSSKTFTSLSEMRGLCPATPVKQGGYAIAGLAHKAHTTDLRSDRQNDPATGKGQTISTYTIAMAKNLPDFVFNVGGNRVTVVPNGYANFGGSRPPNIWRGSSLAQVTVEETKNDAGGNLTYARFLAHWEDSAWGNDYDMDVVSRVSVCVGAECALHDDDGDGALDTAPVVAPGDVRVTTRAILAASGAAMRVGFLIAGTDADGEYTTLEKPSGVQYNSLPLATRDPSEPTPTVSTFTPGTSAEVFLPPPLLLASKYGSFTDSDNDKMPNLQTEWDEDNDGRADTHFFADDPSQIGPKLASYLATISTTSSSASVVANSVSLQTTTRIYQARFDSDDWSGSVVSFPVDVATGTLQPKEWDVANRVFVQDWDTGREWLTWDTEANSGAGGGVPFRWASLTSNGVQQGLLSINPGSGNPDLLGEERLNYLRGKRTLELAGTPGGTFRDRSTPLGDVVNSTPTVLGAPNSGYPDSLESAPYSAFRAANDDVACYEADGVTARSIALLEREPILYFGGNDGALHGASACTGHERIAYVPSAVYPDLNKLTSPNYSHQYYVDGGPTVVDAFWSGAWHSTLVGTLRGGGKGVFALDVTDPSTFDEANAGSIVLWDINPTSDLDNDSVLEYAELGYTFSQPAIVKAEGHGWVAVFGNGYDSASGKAVLYVARIYDGALLAAIDLSAAGPGSGSHGSNNGLSTLSPIDTDGDGDVDLIYGGDLNGNLWRFAAAPITGFSRANTTLLYKAKNAGGVVNQPITSRPAVGFHPTSALGRMVYFGTGKYYESVDQDPTTAVQYNTMYGIWDRDSGTTISSVETRDSSILQQQTIDTQTVNTDFYVRDAQGNIVQDADGNDVKESYDIRIVSNTPVTWTPDGSCATDSSCGWYLDLTETGEKMVATPILRGGRLIYVTTTPSLQACEAGGTGWLMEVDPYTGGRMDVPVFDLNGDGVFDYSDNYQTGTVFTPVSGKRSKVGILQPPAILAGIGGAGDGSYGGAEGKYASGSQNAEIEVTIENPGLLSAGRKSWARVK